MDMKTDGEKMENEIMIEEKMSSEKMSSEKMFDNVANLFLKQNLNGHVNSLDKTMKELEKLIITKALFVFNGNQRKVASLLKIKYTTLHEKVKRWDISFEKQIVFEDHLH